MPEQEDLFENPCDHNWQIINDWGGDPDVINGTYDCSFKRCRVCGEETELEPHDLDDPFPYD